MLLGGYVKLAYASMRASRWRSLLTMLGVIIGVVSVITTVSLGEGVKQQVAQQINQRGADLITVLPGKRDGQSPGLLGNNPFANNSNILFSEADYYSIRRLNSVKSTVPFGRVVGTVKSGKREYKNGRVIASTSDIPSILNQKVRFGTFFAENDELENGAVIGPKVAEELFRENVPMGKTFSVRGREFVVRGIFEDFANTSPLLPGEDYNTAIFIPYKQGQELMGGNMQIYQVLVKPKHANRTKQTANDITAALKANRADQEDFSVLSQTENIALTNEMLNLLTRLVAGIAAISLIVGGIGIMNIMLVSVTERTQEIGIRKAVGATNRQILYQFMIEAAVLSVVGGFLGILFSILANFLIRIFTEFQPVITLPVIGAACGVALVVGVIFGAAPALKAARKDPIDALRYG